MKKFLFLLFLILACANVVRAQAVRLFQMTSDAAGTCQLWNLAQNVNNGNLFYCRAVGVSTAWTQLAAGVPGAVNSSGMTANGLVYASGSNAILSTIAPTNGQLLIGSTGLSPTLGALTGTTNQVNVVNGAGSITLSTPQNTHTGAILQFARLGLGVAADTLAQLNINGVLIRSTISSQLSIFAHGVNGNILIGDDTDPNFLQIVGGPTGNPVQIVAAGSDTNGSITVYTKNAGLFSVQRASGSNDFIVSPTANSVNAVAITGAVTGGGPSIYVQGGDTNVNLSIQGAGTGNIQLASQRANFIVFNGAAAANNPTLTLAGSDSNISLNILPKGNGGIGIGVGSNSAIRLLVDGIDQTSSNFAFVGADSTGAALLQIRNDGLILVNKSTINIVTGGSTTISTGVGSIKMSTANPATNSAWIPIQYAGNTYFVPGFTTNAP